jgi:hypothetical protein
MRVDTALTLINEGLTYHPGWVVCAEDWTHRFEDTVRVTVYLTEARLSERENFPDFTGQVDPPGARARFLLTVGDVADAAELVFRLVRIFERNMSHEIREFTRVRDTGWAPLHPHTIDGRARWSDLSGDDPLYDLAFGVA